jgi:DNA-binding transcriptional ArsR family regulator
MPNQGQELGYRDRDMAPTTQDLIDALASPVRREILWLTWDREVAATEISGHLAVLRDAGLVDMRRDGTFRRYRARRAAMDGLQGLIADDRKWLPGARPLALETHRHSAVAVVEVDAPVTAAEAFTAFTDATVYSRWLGGHVSIGDGLFAATTDFGVEVRGTYDHLLPPRLIAMRWDFATDEVPVPGHARRAYVEIDDAPGGCHVTVHQIVDDVDRAVKMERVWSLVLSRFRDGVRAALT